MKSGYCESLERLQKQTFIHICPTSLPDYMRNIMPTVTAVPGVFVSPFWDLRIIFTTWHSWGVLLTYQHHVALSFVQFPFLFTPCLDTRRMDIYNPPPLPSFCLFYDYYYFTAAAGFTRRRLLIFIYTYMFFFFWFRCCLFVRLLLFISLMALQLIGNYFYAWIVWRNW